MEDDSIKIDIKVTGCEEIDWMELTVKAAMTKFCNHHTEPSVYLKAVNSLTDSSTIKFWNKRLYFAKVCYVQTKVIEFLYSAASIIILSVTP